MESLIPVLDQLLIISLILTIPIYWIKQQKKLSIQLTLSTALAWIISHLIKYTFPTTRPYLEQDIQALVNRPPTNGAFPSAHTTTAFTIATIIYLYHKKSGIIAFLVAALVGLMRILGRVHYPIDILGGVILGISIAYTTHALLKKYTKD